MQKKNWQKKQRSSRDSAGPQRQWRLCSLDEGLALIFSDESYRRQRLVAGFWKNWETVLGEDLACLAFPLGHKNDQLLIGAEDNMALQELSMQSQEILERVNGFMGEEVFTKVKVVLLLGQRPLSAVRAQRPSAPLCPPIPPRPPRLGSLRDSLAADSLVARCYEAYVAMYADYKA